MTVIPKIIKENISNKTLKAGAFWTISGFGGEIVIRMVSSLVLTRIFLPEVFGLMAIITSIMMGLEMLTDVGVRASLIQNPNAKSQDFAQTAWTVQILRGIILWMILFGFSETLAGYFVEPLLEELLPVAGVVLILRGFTSTNQYLYSRELGVSKIVLAKIIEQLCSITFVISFSIIYESIWAIVWGSLFSVFINIVIGYFLFKQFPMRFKLNREVLKHLVKLGKWLFLATIFHFFVSQGDRLILGALIDKSDLGNYNLAAMFIQIPIGVLSALSGNILMPYLSSSFNESPQDFNQKFNMLLRKILHVMLPLVALLAISGNLGIKLLYTTEFHFAGEILQFLAFASFFQVVAFTLIPIFISKGDSFRHMLVYLSLFSLYLPAIYFGYKNFEIWGALFGMFSSQLVWLPIVIYFASKHVKIELLWIIKTLSIYISFSLVCVMVFALWN